MQNMSSVDPNSQVHITPECEQECIKANISIYNNLAACLLASLKDKNDQNNQKNEKELEKVIQYADIVLELDSKNDKALFRKAHAQKQLRNFSNARENFELLKGMQGLKVSKDVIQGIKDCTEALKESDKKEKSMYKNMFSGKNDGEN